MNTITRESVLRILVHMRNNPGDSLRIRSAIRLHVGILRLARA